MAKHLVIVESPAKAKTINKYLGKAYIVKSSVGHIRDLPVSGSRKNNVDASLRAKAAAITRKMSPEEKAVHKKKRAAEQLISRMGINPDRDWEAHYEILPGKEKVVSELKKYSEKVENIYLATDRDREGEAIAWHLKEVIGEKKKNFRRVVFNEITKNAITRAFENPADLDMDHVKAQQARRFLDRVVGYMVSPLLWAKIARGLSAGRVQSVAVRLIVEREKEIGAFVPEEYWEIFASLGNDTKKTALFKVVKYDSRNFRPGSKDETARALSVLENSGYRVAGKEEKPGKTHPSPPFITSTLQQAASTRLGYSVKKTMMLAQRLYEAGYITYMRTDSTNLSVEAVDASRKYISEKFGKKYLPSEPRIYSNKKGSQEAHEAIRPSDVFVMPEQKQKIDADAVKLYKLIWQRFLACQMPSSEYLTTNITVKADKYELRTKGRTILFDGFTRVLPQLSKKSEDILLPEFELDEALKLLKLESKQHFTKPPARYSEAGLVKELEKRRIGRPSTYASIISTIQDRGYVSLEKKRFYAKKIGDVVTERLLEQFNDLLDYDFTANLEELLDKIAGGKIEWKKVLDDFYKDFKKKLDQAYSDKGGMRPNIPVATSIKCPECGRHMNIRIASTGVFLGCSGYSLPPKERCKSTINLIPGQEVVSLEEDEDAESRILRNKHRCNKCDTPMDNYLIDEERKIHICGKNPDCDGYEIEKGQFKIKGYDGPVLECDKCGAEMQLKTGRFGKYFDCTARECKNTRKLLRNGEPAPPKMDPVPMPELECSKVEDTYILRDGAAGLFLAASKFPKNRETRAPYIDELLPHKKEIDPKYKPLFSAPVEDPDGNRVLVRFSRKTKEQYVMSEKDGKPTGWRLYYRAGRWVENP